MHYGTGQSGTAGASAPAYSRKSREQTGSVAVEGMSSAAMHPPSMHGRRADLAGTLGRCCVWLLIAIGTAIIFVPLLLTLYLSLFDEKLILFPPRGYTLAWYAAIMPNFGGAVAITLELAVAAVVGSLLLGV